MRDRHAGIKQMCSSGVRFGRSKLLQSCSNFTLKPELEQTVTACLAGRDAQEVFRLDLSDTERRFKAIAILARLSNADIHKTAFSAKTYTVIPF